MIAPRRLIAICVAIAHIIATCMLGLPVTASAQSADAEPPTIEFERITEGVLGDTQVFSAAVEDDRELSAVTLHYRLGESASYTSVPMTSLAGTSIHTASVDTKGTEALVVQYYLEARDAAGNRSIQGFAFDPLERSLVAPEQRALASTSTAIAAPVAFETNNMSTGRKVLYGILGLVVVGAIAGAAGGTGGDGDNPAADDPGTVPVRILVDPL